MRKQIRNEIVETLSVLENKFRQIKETSQTAMLVPCIALLQSIKKKCKKNLSEQRFLYYTEIFDGILLALQKRERMQHASLVEVCDLCTELLQFVMKELLKEKEVKKEIVFLPYKASMWDSLESIWRAAAADTEHCDAYVVPIPYCDRNPDGSAAAWHCEADVFPDDVPVMDYREYDLKKRRPDVIYIHNPYDGNNRVTSVAPDYYSYELKKYTEMLVYVPYFVSGEIIEAHFCKTPGIINADKVIVQSEAIKEQYEKYYMGGEVPTGKFLACGSPKFDKILESTRADFKLPLQWHKLLQRKKSILYNTTISALLKNADVFLANLRYVFSVFKNRKDLVLWWRPHPLLRATIESMIPSILDEYDELVQLYKNVGWGIYDDSSDINRAISWTDAYYGDPSSIVHLYKVTGKPSIIQDWDMQAKINFKMSASDFFVYYKLLNSKRDSVEIPQLWENFIVGKKVLFYNISMVNLFEDAEKVISKLLDVFSFFKRRKDIVLWYWENPLLKSILRSSNLKLLSKYEKIQHEYKNDGWGIYDDSLTPYRASVWTDAYYGDFDPILWVCKFSQKPIMIQDLNMETYLSSNIFNVLMDKKSDVLTESVSIREKYINCYLFIEPSLKNLQEIIATPCGNLLHVDRLDFDLPKDWRTKVQGKKVVFYYIDKSSLSDDPVEMERHLRYAFSVFRNSGDFILWWYVDAGVKEAIKFMDLKIAKQYEKLEKECKISNWGIYDDSENFQRANAWTDAYYGNLSSFMWVFKASGKPTMLQNIYAQEDASMNVFDFVTYFSVQHGFHKKQELLESWRGLIQGKEVILYNMTFSSIIKNASKINSKIRYVFSIFKDENDIVLWWKVDPDIEFLLKCFFPKILEEYCEIKQQYIDEGWGIYDNTVKIHSAITYANGYYGDNDGIIPLYASEKKIILLQNMNVLA